MVFFDAADVTRAWISPEQIKPYSAYAKTFKDGLKNDKFKKRIQIAITQANDAEKLPLYTRLTKYSFIARYPGSINKPKIITKHDVIKYQNKIKRKYNYGNAYPSESAEKSHKAYETEENEQCGFPVKKNNVIILGTPNRPKEKKSGITKKYEPTYSLKTVQNPIAGEVSSQLSHEEDEKNVVQFTMNEDAKQTDSMVLQVGNAVASLVTEESPDNGNNVSNLLLLCNYLLQYIHYLGYILIHKSFHNSYQIIHKRLICFRYIENLRS